MPCVTFRLPYGHLPPPRKLRARTHHIVFYLLKTRIFFSLEAQLSFLKTRSHFKDTINFLNLIQSLKLKSKKAWPLCFTSRGISASWQLQLGEGARPSAHVPPGGIFRFLLFTVPRIAIALCFSVILFVLFLLGRN